MTTAVTVDQLRNLTDRAAHGLTPDEQARLRDGISQLEALQAVARGYCPACGRGDAAPTVADWEQERQRADHAEAALARVRALAEFTRNHVAPGRDDMSLAQHELACAILGTLAEPGPAAPQATEAGRWLLAGTRDLSIPQPSEPADEPARTIPNNPATPARPWSTCTVPADHGPHPWHDPWPLPHGQDAHCPGRPTPNPEEQP